VKDGQGLPASGLPALPEESHPIETLLRMAGRDAVALATLAARGDWQGRVLALSGLGRLIREDPSAFGPPLLTHRLVGRFPFLRPLFPGAASGVVARATLSNRVMDRVWIVRTAAALGLGECLDPALLERLRPLLEDPYRPVRIAAGAALVRCGARPEDVSAAILEGAEPAPSFVGDTHSSREWLRTLAGAHTAVLESFLAIPLAPHPEGRDPDAWSRFLMGEPRARAVDTRRAEIVRYAQEKEHHHNFTKPFTPGQREQNLQLLHSFLAVAENMRVPHAGRVLDLGGGAAWVSDLLVKLGYRAITLDIAEALLHVGLDRFTREHQTARFTCGDMASLPFADKTFDAVVVIDALHHCPDVPAVFKEAHRVLVAGGQFLLAEPGEGHAESPRSRREDLEHSICEREIHLQEAVQYARSAGFTAVDVIPHFVPALHMDPEAMDAATRTPSETWRVRQGPSRVSFDEYLLQSILSHPILVLGKGERRLDSRLPGLLRARLAAELVRTGPRLFGTAEVLNEGDTDWLKGGDEPGRVRLGLQLLGPDRSLLNLDFARVELPKDLSPGEAVSLAVDVALPDPEAPYVLKLDMVDEHLCWFEDVGSRPLYLSL
jgi:SAM-dependent methyltransferase